MPILIKQYMQAGGRVLGFNVDPRFSHVLDVLMMAAGTNFHPPFIVLQQTTRYA